MRWIPFIIFIIIVQWYAFQAIKTITQNKFWWAIYALVVGIILGGVLWQTLNFDRTVGWTPIVAYSLGMFVALLSGQLLMICLLFLEDLSRGASSLLHFFTSDQKIHFPQRRKFVSQMAIALGAIPFSSLLYGMYKGRYNYRVLNYTLEYENLPDGFDGFQITQISDLHCGSFDNTKKVAYGLDLIDKQKSDLVLFTGDMVNNKANEARPWVEFIAKIKAPYGKFSVLGNHDYGDYSDWENEAHKKQNMEEMYQIHQDMGFDLLLNESRYIEKNGDRIALVGVENWGAGRFKKAGDLEKSISKIEPNDFKILLSHDPSHWEAEVIPHAYPFHLTLSGHTHGFQFGIEIPGWIKWSPIQWRYKQWAGIYENKEQKLNVNRGFGYLAYPGRVGIWPEITVITLKKKKLLV
ncbi:MAG: 3',5'-cyclic adenosine monophosphate phosphodiesterase CpdA [Flavobacteriaceae bacterium]|nr:MAG: 3',5'-cyclic adenosine monophosphate phosphodiesterase CpdA [Flavobacteriaceae bacterium]